MVLHLKCSPVSDQVSVLVSDQVSILISTLQCRQAISVFTSVNTLKTIIYLAVSYYMNPQPFLITLCISTIVGQSVLMSCTCDISKYHELPLVICCKNPWYPSNSEPSTQTAHCYQFISYVVSQGSEKVSTLTWQSSIQRFKCLMAGLLCDHMTQDLL